MSHLKLSLPRSPPGSSRRGQKGACSLSDQADGRGWRAHLPWFGLVPRTLVASAALMVPPGSCSLITSISLPVSPLRGLRSAVHKAGFFCAHVWGELVFGAGSGIWGWFCSLLVTPGRGQEGLVQPQFWAGPCQLSLDSEGTWPSLSFILASAVILGHQEMSHLHSVPCEFL